MRAAAAAVLALALLPLASAVPARVVERTYETTAYPCTPLDGAIGAGLWCARTGYNGPYPVTGDGSIDLGAVTESPAAGETHVAVVARDRLTQSGALGFLCQDVNLDGGCDTNAGSPDRWAFVCGGALLPTPIVATLPVHVFVMPPTSRLSGCPHAQGPTVAGNVTFTFT